MTASILEQERTLHEELERLENGVLSVLEQIGQDQTARDGYKMDVVQSHAINFYLARIQEIGTEILPKLYEDKDRVGQEEIASITGSGPQAFSVFYEKLKEVRRYHSQHPNLPVQDPEKFAEIEDIEKVVPQFSGEESYGKCLDLHLHYDRFINLRQDNHIPYSRYLDKFWKIPEPKHPRSEQYKTYLNQLVEYLVDFLVRSRPLSDIKPQIDEIDAIWKKQIHNQANPLFCVPCNKLFSNQNVFIGHLSGKKHQKAAEKLKNNNVTSLDLEIDRLEFKVFEICSRFLQEQIFNTKVTVEVKFSRTNVEILKEIEAEEKQASLKAGIKKAEEEEEDITEIKTTKDNYPVGWDGKPIPYWLYKLHGLGVEYKCEICGNHSYWGRKNFEAHFQEGRHARGMKVLGIPNTKHFQNITVINEAIALWQKIQRDSFVKNFQPDNEEEYEDSEGNVYKRKVFEDLKRQGLV